MAEHNSFTAHERRFPNSAAMMDALCAQIVASLQEGLAAGRGASLVVPGGHTPVPLFDRLSQAPLDWQSVWVTLTDERWVDTQSSASNEHLVREHLLRNAAAEAQFMGLKSSQSDPQLAAAACWSSIAEMPRPFDYVLLGMGDDGHVASLFPDSPGLANALDQAQPPGCAAMTAPAAPRTRMTLNLRALLDSRRIGVLIAGDSKWATYERSRARGPAVDMPVRALFAQQNVPVTVWWAP